MTATAFDIVCFECARCGMKKIMSTFLVAWHTYRPYWENVNGIDRLVYGYAKGERRRLHILDVDGKIICLSPPEHEHAFLLREATMEEIQAYVNELHEEALKENDRQDRERIYGGMLREKLREALQISEEHHVNLEDAVSEILGIAENY